MKRYTTIILSLIFSGVCHSADYPDQGLVERTYITGESLKNNIVHQHHGQEALVYLPRGYYENREKTYPTLYILHGFGGNAISWFRDNKTMPEPNLKPILDTLISNESFPETIVVVTDFNTRHIAGWYQNSPITGNWRDFFVEDVIGHIDSQFRTIQSSEKRALLGQSMGGYGVIDIALDTPELFTAVAALSPANILLRSLSPYEFMAFHESVKPAIKSYTGLQSQIPYLGHAFMALSQIVAFDKLNPPTFIKEHYKLEDYQAISNLSLEAQMEHDHIFEKDYSHIEIRTEMGLGEGQRAVEHMLFINEKLSELGFQVSGHTFDGGHDDKLRDNITTSLLFLGEELK